MPDDVMPPNVNAANQGPEQMSLAVQETGDNQNSSSVSLLICKRNTDCSGRKEKGGIGHFASLYLPHLIGNS